MVSRRILLATILACSCASGPSGAAADDVDSSGSAKSTTAIGAAGRVVSTVKLVPKLGPAIDLGFDVPAQPAPDEEHDAMGASGEEDRIYFKLEKLVAEEPWTLAFRPAGQTHNGFVVVHTGQPGFSTHRTWSVEVPAGSKVDLGFKLTTPCPWKDGVVVRGSIKAMLPSDKDEEPISVTGEFSAPVFAGGKTVACPK